MTTGQVVLAHYEDLLDGGLAAWSSTFAAQDEVTLAISVPAAEQERALAALAEAAGPGGHAEDLDVRVVPVDDFDDVLGLAEIAAARLGAPRQDGLPAYALGGLGDLREALLGPPPEPPRAPVPEGDVIDQFAAAVAARSTLRVEGTPPLLRQPVLMVGDGVLRCEPDVSFGWPRSSGGLLNHAYVEVNRAGADITIGARTLLNNDVALRAEGPGIEIGADCLIGNESQVYDSDFHAVHPAHRNDEAHFRMGRTRIGDNVWLGVRVIVLRGTTIGDDAVIGAGSVVKGDIPAGAIAVGNPATVVGWVPGYPAAD